MYRCTRPVRNALLWIALGAAWALPARAQSEPQIEQTYQAVDREVGARLAHVAQMYNVPTLDQAETLLDQYEIRYVVVGELERKQYQPGGLQKFETLEVAFRSGQTTVYRR